MACPAFEVLIGIYLMKSRDFCCPINRNRLLLRQCSHCHLVDMRGIYLFAYVYCSTVEPLSFSDKEMKCDHGTARGRDLQSVCEQCHGSSTKTSCILVTRSMAMHCTALHYTTRYDAIRYDRMRYGTIRYDAIRHDTVQITLQVQVGGSHPLALALALAVRRCGRRSPNGESPLSASESLAEAGDVSVSLRSTAGGISTSRSPSVTILVEP